MTIDEMAEAWQAAKSGKKLQWHDGKEWKDFDPSKTAGLYDWRIKPEPREWTICEDSLSRGCPSGGHKQVRVREVLP